METNHNIFEKKVLSGIGSMGRSFAYTPVYNIKTEIKAFFVLLILVSISLIVIHVPDRVVITAVINDYLFAVSEHQRIYEGHYPNIDFMTPLGPLHYHLVRMAVWMKGVDPTGVAFAGSFFAAFVAIAGYYFLRLRFSPFLTVFLLLCAFFSGVAMRGPDSVYYQLTHFAFYNRLSWMLLIIGLCLCFFKADITKRNQAILDGIFTGLILSFAVLIKPTNIVIAAGCFFVYIYLAGKSRYFSYQAISVILTSIAMAGIHIYDLLLLYDVIGFFASTNPGREMVKIQGIFIDNLFLVLTTGLLLIVIEQYRKLNTPDSGITLSLAMISFVLGFYGAMMNHEDTLVAAFVPLLLAGFFLTKSGPDSSTFKGIRASILIFPAIFVAGLGLAQNKGSVFHHFFFPGTFEHQVLSDRNTVFENKIYFTHRTGAAKQYYQDIQDMSAAINALNLPSENSIFLLDFTSPLAAFTHHRSPRGDIQTWLDYGRTFTSTSYIAPELFFKDIDILVIPKGRAALLDGPKLFDIYSSYIEAHYTSVYEDVLFQVFVREQKELPE